MDSVATIVRAQRAAILETADSESRSCNCDANPHAVLGSPFRACSSKTLGVLGVSGSSSEKLGVLGRP